MAYKIETKYVNKGTIWSFYKLKAAATSILHKDCTIANCCGIFANDLEKNLQMIKNGLC